MYLKLQTKSKIKICADPSPLGLQMSLLSGAPSVTEEKGRNSIQGTSVNKIVGLPSPKDVLPGFLRPGDGDAGEQQR